MVERLLQNELTVTYKRGDIVKALAEVAFGPDGSVYEMTKCQILGSYKDEQGVNHVVAKNLETGFEFDEALMTHGW